jgi:exo-beta-1,3-glucanase (GH17 family)
MHFSRLLAALLLASLSAFGLWWWSDRPVPVEAEWTKPITSVVFSSFRRGQDPLHKIYPSAEQIEADLEALQGKALGVRVYTAREGMQIVPPIAERLGLKVTLSAALYADEAENEKELAAVIAEANAYPEVIQRVLVGNEVLLRGDLPPEKLIAAIRKVKSAIKQPVSYADQWEWYLKYPDVIEELDFLTIHIYPFWEDVPMPVEQAGDYMVKVVDRIRTAFPGKPLLIGETGWPSLGRDRGPSVVNLVNEARFVREIANVAAQNDFDYNLCEAFDQPWKSGPEGTVGAAWGILDEARQPKFPMTGPVTEVADWPLRATVALTLAALATLGFARRLKSFGALLTFAFIAEILAWLLVTTGFHAAAVTFRVEYYWWLPIRVLLPALLALAFLARARDWLENPSMPAGGNAPWFGTVWMSVSGFYASVWTFLLLWDGRYRDIPEFDFAVPVAGTLLLLALRAFLLMRQGGRLGEALSFVGFFPGFNRYAASALALLLPLAAAAGLLSEPAAMFFTGRDFAAAHPALTDQIPYLAKALFWNREMDLWVLMLLAWSVPFLYSRRPVRAAASLKGERQE